MTMQDQTTTFEDLDRPLWGAEAIGSVIGLEPNQALHLLQKHHLPASRVGRKYVTTKRKLLEAINNGGE